MLGVAELSALGRRAVHTINIGGHRTPISNHILGLLHIMIRQTNLLRQINK